MAPAYAAASHGTQREDRVAARDQPVGACGASPAHVALLPVEVGQGRAVKADRIETRHIDFGIGVLRGVLSRPELGLLSSHEVDFALKLPRFPW